MFDRRHVMLGALGACCLPRARARAASFAPFREIAPGIHVRRGVDEEATRDNADAIANAGFIIGGEQVLVFDPGGSLADGAALRAAIRERTQLPIRHVVMSHAHPDHVFGAGAFIEDKPAFVGHARLAAALATRGDYYRERLEAVLGKGAAGPVVTPTLEVTDTLELDLGGRTVRLAAHPPAHSDCDLTLLDVAGGTLFCGDLLFVRRVPALDGSVLGWLQVLEALKKVGAAQGVTGAVPGHGPERVDWPAGVADLERYLRTLVLETRVTVRDNIGIAAAVGKVGAGERGRWALFDDYHGRNVTQVYKELEWE
ncbi:MAG TPA: quinoprotein relay system zinc metallohydrolase 2 [Dongiaceae bacterium]|nr:quinoprotein relay system zinc metallohydrolase 2 [Dongiaceae bacterium]